MAGINSMTAMAGTGMALIMTERITGTDEDTALIIKKAMVRVIKDTEVILGCNFIDQGDALRGHLVQKETKKKCNNRNNKI